ncbi:MAG: HAMP domain-containing sensor histidine kinase [Candidatus Omnitrophota bacterium]
MTSSRANRISGFLAVAGAVALVVGLTFLDSHVSRHPSLIVFYLAPVFLATWFSGSKSGYFIAFCSAASWFLKYGHHIVELYYSPAFFYVNMAARACFVFLMAYLLAKLKATMEHEQELVKRVKSHNEELKKMDARKSAFVANVSHELKNPLAVIRESISLILDKIVGEVSVKQKEILEIAGSSTDRLLRLVTDLLDLSQIESGKLKLKKEKIDLHALVKEVMKTYQMEISKKQLTLRKEIQPKPEFLIGDRDKLMEVIINLLNNAIKYTSHGSITVKLTGDAREVRFEIADTGPGIPEESLDKIFDKFERILAEKQEGTGLGLPIAKDIVELHQGRLWVESELGKGSRFIFTLPRPQGEMSHLTPQ